MKTTLALSYLLGRLAARLALTWEGRAAVLLALGLIVWWA